jgi:GNAT superfamily N-acetyltransferase
LDVTYIKDYDEIEGPLVFARDFNYSSWGLNVVRVEGVPVGSALVAFNTRGVEMLEGREDLAVLWDIRVHPSFRKQGMGFQLFSAACAWAKDHGCNEIKIETQNINVAACNFYQRQGCKLTQVKRGAYSLFPDEIQFIWRKRL